MHAYLDYPKIDAFEEYLAGNMKLLNERDQVNLRFGLDSMYGSVANRQTMDRVYNNEDEELETNDFAPI